MVRPAWLMIQDTRQLQAVIKTLRAQKQHHNLIGLTHSVNIITVTLNQMDAIVRDYGFLGKLPWIGTRYQNAATLLLAADLTARGFQPVWPLVLRVARDMGYGPAQDGRQTLTGRQALGKLVSLLPSLKPALAQAMPFWTRANAALQSVNFSLLPAQLQQLGIMKEGEIKSTALQDYRAIRTLQQMLPVLPTILGVPKPQRYWLLFQNSGELRATGGFITSYGFLTLNRGRPQHMTAYNIYQLDTHHLPNPIRYRPPEPPMLARYFTFPFWHLRDANTSPDVPQAVHTLYRFYQSDPSLPTVHGVIMVDTWFLDMVLKDLGGITLPATYGNVRLTAQNANIQMEYIAERSNLPRTVRKGFIGFLMKDLWHTTMSAHGSQLRHLMGTIIQGLNDKYIVLYFNNATAERAVTAANWGGTIKRHWNGDYLEVVDENLGAYKDNFFVTESITSTIRRNHGQWIQTTRVLWTNPAVENWMVTHYRGWIRLYVPWGSRLLSMVGGNGMESSYNNPGIHKTVFSTHLFMGVRKTPADPPAQHSLTVTYVLPSGLNLSQYLIQKQPGARPPREHLIDGAFSTSWLLVHDRIIDLPRP